jgi:membrane protein
MATPRSLSRPESRIESLVTWFAASVLTAAAVIYAMKRDDSRQKAQVAFGATTPATEPLSLQQTRAMEAGRGREATTPTRIPWRGWKDIFVRTYYEIQDDRLLSLAAGVVFYSLVALFPAIAAGVSVYAFFSDAKSIASHLSLLADFMPGASLELLSTEITRIAGTAEGKLTTGFVVGFGIALWSANAGMKAIFDALNIIYDEEEKRGIIWLNVVSLFFTFCAIGGMLVAVGAIVVLPLFLAAFGLSSVDTPFLIGILRWPALFVLLIMALGILYRYGPSRRRPKWRWITVGSVFAALVWISVSLLFSWYLGNFANYNATYGALGAVVGLMMWMWLSTIIVLVGAELNSEIERQTAIDSTTGSVKPLGTRGAVAADTVGPAKAA